MAATSPAVFITVPKYVALTHNPTVTLPKIRPAPTTTVQGTPDGATAGNVVVEDGASAPRAKKRRLDHLTWEEKIQRKKLKNRVAAQTSRDRKKARMEDMERELDELTEKTELLQNKCESLQAINESLLEKNHKLDMELELLRQQLNEMQQQQKQQQVQVARNAAKLESKNAASTCAGCESILNGSAVSIYTDPLPQGSPQMDSQSTEEQLKKSNSVASLWRIVALCLLFKICSSSTKNSMPGSLKSLPKASWPISQQTWKLVMERAMKMMPKLQAAQSDCLDQWWGPKQSAWNPANIQKHEVTA
ncbi:PREDICTED: X-box-binding protein 1 isoform X1 [Rhagoletis zephyria]|uniref:X-box-binding protein 1 isoform X1 n=1 Tax=Rhagoletis zephyria TaxID=28612 RepID=UPI0008115B80|nr:PREDICTED: X-box-binding protein 1 isoform X1 [Rhagoletis zephyria]